jgi:hypothetical protein
VNVTSCVLEVLLRLVLLWLLLCELLLCELTPELPGLAPCDPAALEPGWPACAARTAPAMTATSVPLSIRFMLPPAFLSNW